ncbi:ETHYLENE INSENSITIVE 3-LIKE 1 PROTEIN [Salix viminalis]|uniref:ETHYLENE INSENSITIVE 3-LIKE 1 PROTEIN n=1 Tax=Salix viminalis TaxID=40686 RepID=A0A9Q0QKG8_SALVM|nr:ETHYLENE INSENSITIVE 3-LIKE 1 PROTEIN [Salix viminalis]
MEQKIYTCEAVQCAYSQIRLGFPDRASRDNHQLNCPYRSTSLEFRGSNFHVNEVKPVIFPQPSAQSKTTVPLVNPAPSSFDLSGVPEDGQKMISELMSIYDTNIQGNKNTNPGNNLVTGPNVFLPKIQHQQDHHFRSQSNTINGNIFEESSINQNHHMLSQEGGQFDRFKPLNSPFENSMFCAPFDLSSFDYKDDLQVLGMDALPKHQDVSTWF